MSSARPGDTSGGEGGGRGRRRTPGGDPPRRRGRTRTRGRRRTGGRISRTAWRGTSSIGGRGPYDPRRRGSRRGTTPRESGREKVGGGRRRRPDLWSDGKKCPTAANIALTGWAKSGRDDAEDRARSLLGRMESLHDLALTSGLSARSAASVAPDRFTYNLVLDVVSRSGDPGAPARCLALLDRTERIALSGRNARVLPDDITYSVALKAYASAGDADGAEAVLRRMKGRARGGARAKATADRESGPTPRRASMRTARSWTPGRSRVGRRRHPAGPRSCCARSWTGASCPIRSPLRRS